MVIVYKESPINWHLLGHNIQVDNYGLVNLVAEGSAVVVELVRNDLNGEQLAGELLALLEPARNQEVRNELHGGFSEAWRAGETRNEQPQAFWSSCAHKRQPSDTQSFSQVDSFRSQTCSHWVLYALGRAVRIAFAPRLTHRASERSCIK